MGETVESTRQKYEPSRQEVLAEEIAERQAELAFLNVRELLRESGYEVGEMMGTWEQNWPLHDRLTEKFMGLG